MLPSSVFPIRDIIDRSRFWLDLKDYDFSEPRLYQYVDRNKLAYTLPIGNLKSLITNARMRFPNLPHSIHPINSQRFTKSRYLLYLRYIFALYKLHIDSHILKKIIDYVWVPIEVRIFTKDALYLINGMEIEWIKAFTAINWDKSRKKVEKVALEKNITHVSLVSSGVLIDVLLQSKLIFLNPITRTYSFNKSEVDLIPKPPLLPHWTPRRLKHIELQCKPEELYRIVRNHMGLLGIKEQ